MSATQATRDKSRRVTPQAAARSEKSGDFSAISI